LRLAKIAFGTLGQVGVLKEHGSTAC